MMRVLVMFPVLLLLLVLATMSGELRSSVAEVPPPLSQLAGEFVGSVAGATLQRMVLRADGTGEFAEVWVDADGGCHALRYSLVVRDYEDWRITLELTPLHSAGDRIQAAGEADFFAVTLNLGTSERYRERSVRLYRESTFLRMLDFARGNSVDTTLEETATPSERSSPDGSPVGRPKVPPILFYQSTPYPFRGRGSSGRGLGSVNQSTPHPFRGRGALGGG